MPALAGRLHHGMLLAHRPAMDEHQTDPARRVDAPADPETPDAADLPYDEEMTEPDEANAPDAREDLPSGDEQILRD